MDEPLSNLDAKLRVQTRAQISKIQKRLGVTTVYVTHDQVEAMTMADRIAVLKDGILQQFAPPSEMFSRPVNVFVAGFIGSPSMNLYEFDVVDGAIQYGTFRIELGRAQKAALTSPRVVVGSRPEGFRILEQGEPGVQAVVDVVEELGTDTYVYLMSDDGTDREITLRRPPEERHAVGDHLTVRPARSVMHLFDAATGLRLPDYDAD